MSTKPLYDAEAEYRVLAGLIDHEDMVLKSTHEELFTENRRRLFRAFRDCILEYGFLSYEGVEKHYKAPIPPQIEAARGAKPQPLIDKLKVLATKRQIHDMMRNLEGLLNKDEPELLDIQEATAFKPILVSQDTTLSYGIMQFVSDLNRKRSGQYRFTETGISFLDYMLGGEWPQQALTVVIGKAGGGKTALVCNSMLNMARLEQPIPSLFISLEMRKHQLVSRMVATLKRIDGSRLKRAADIDDAEMRMVDSAIEEIQSLPVYVDDRPGLSVSEIVNMMRFHKEAHNIKVVFVDYLQIINDESSSSIERTESLGHICQQLRNAAVELDLAVVLLSQQNRVSSGLESILGSGRVGQIADVVFEIKLEDTISDDLRICEFDFHKNREGPLGKQNARYLPKFLTFE